MKKCICDEDFAEALRKVLCVLCCPRPKVVKVVSITFKGVTFQSEGKVMLTVKDTEVPASGTYKFSFKDAKSNTAKVDGVPTIASSDPTVVDTIGPVTDNGDGTFQAPFHVLDNIGVAQTTINADVDLGAGVNNKDFVDVVSVIAGDAATIKGDFGTLTPDPAP